MTKALLIINSELERAKAIRWVSRAPIGTHLEFRRSKRSLEQNARMWAMLTDIAVQAIHNETKYTADQWKILFMHACGRELQFIPGLDRRTFIPWGQSSSKLTKQEMTDLIEFMFAWGAENNIVFHEPEARNAA